MKNELKKIRKYIEKNWGKKHKEFDVTCITCRIHRSLEDLEEIVRLSEELKN